MDNQTATILWTGGWDSTYRIIELSRKNITIVPIYIIGDNRTSEQYEKQAIERITSLLRQHPATKAVIKPVHYVEKKEIPTNEAISEAYKRIEKTTHLGKQHDWLARYAFYHPGLEIGTEAGEPETSHIIDAIQQYGVIKKERDTYVLDKEKSSDDGLLVLGNFEFPIIDKYETDMLRNINNWGYQDVMKEIWFCHEPIGGKPCGFCHPCVVKMESSMEYLLPTQARRRYAVWKMIAKIFSERIADGLCRRLFRRKK